MKKRLIVGISIVLVIAGLFLWQKTRTSSKDSAVAVAAVTPKTLVKTISSSGKTKAKRSAVLKFQTGGKLTWVGVSQGDRVYAYQAVAKLDPREVEKILKESLIDYSKQRNDFEETWRVAYKGTHNPDEALTDTIKRILQKNQWDLDRAVLDVELKALAVEYATLTSPIDGIVTKVSTPVAGVNVLATTEIVEIADPDSLVFEANIDEVDVGNLMLAQSASVALDAFPDATFSGKISSIAYASQLSSGGATVFPVEISFDSPQALRMGLNGDVTITTATVSDALVVPLAAIREENGGSKYVYKKSGETYQKTAVETGLGNDDDVIIASGLVQGDQVVVKGFSQLDNKK